MCSCILFLTGLTMVYIGIHHWPDQVKDRTNIIIDAEFEEINPKQNKIDTYA